MPAYVVLINFTDQGIRDVERASKRTKEALAAAEKLGITIKEAKGRIPCLS